MAWNPAMGLDPPSPGIERILDRLEAKEDLARLFLFYLELLYMPGEAETPAMINDHLGDLGKRRQALEGGDGAYWQLVRTSDGGGEEDLPQAA
jgi:hypothetical protein